MASGRQTLGMLLNILYCTVSSAAPPPPNKGSSSPNVHRPVHPLVEIEAGDERDSQGQCVLTAAIHICSILFPLHQENRKISTCQAPRSPTSPSCPDAVRKQTSQVILLKPT